MAHVANQQNEDYRPPRLRPTWTTWMWLGFGVMVVVLTVIGLWQAGTAP
jgi:hypothetical protein